MLCGERTGSIKAKPSDLFHLITCVCVCVSMCVPRTVFSARDRRNRNAEDFYFLLHLKR